MVVGNVFIEISIIIVIVAVVSGIVKLLKQPLIIGYILSGILLMSFNTIKSLDIISTFSEIGVALLLFIVGLHMRPQIIKEVGKVSLLAGAGQVALSFLLGFFASKLLGFSNISSLYIGIALMFSSTIIVMKLLSDKGELDTLHGKISIGILIFQDLVAIIALIIISSLSQNSGFGVVILSLLIKGTIAVAILSGISIYILPRLEYFFARSQEFLFLFSIAWGLGLATLFHIIGLSIEIGALMAGIILSMSPYHYEISSRMRVLRDFFVILFFVLLGSQVILPQTVKEFLPILILSLTVIFGHIIFIMIFIGVLGYNKRSGFLTGSALSQISEFSLILVALGVRIGHIPNQVLSMITLVGLITILISTYLVLYSNKIYGSIGKYLVIFEKKKVRKDKKKKEYDMILFGYNRVGYDFVNSFKKLGKRFLIVDYNPEVISNLLKEKIDCEYGDVDDVEFLDQLNLKNMKMGVSTIPNFETNLLLIKTIRKTNKKAIVMCVSHHVDEVHKLYSAGASYVIMPHFLGGRYASMLIDKHKFSIEKFSDEKKKHIDNLRKRKELGHTHPEVEKNK